MFMPSIMNDDLFDDLFDYNFYMPVWADADEINKKLYGKKAAHEMKTDVRETDNGYEVAVDLPGFKKDDVKVSLENGYLTISAEKNLNNDEKNKEGKYIRRERYSGNMSRSFYVGDQLTTDEVHAKFSDGILTLSLPKKEETKKVEDKSHMIPIAA